MRLMLALIRFRSLGLAHARRLALAIRSRFSGSVQARLMLSLIRFRVSGPLRLRAFLECCEPFFMSWPAPRRVNAITLARPQRRRDILLPAAAPACAPRSQYFLLFVWVEDTIPSANSHFHFFSCVNCCLSRNKGVHKGYFQTATVKIAVKATWAYFGRILVGFEAVLRRF